MLVKVLSRTAPTYKSLLKYILNEQKAKDGRPIILRHNVRSMDIDGIAHEFILNESYRKHPRKGQVYIHHSIVSISANEDPKNITTEMLTDLGLKFMHLWGKDGMHFGAIHNNGTDHAHIHIITSGCKLYTGLSSRLTKANLQEVKVQLQEYQQDRYAVLTESICAHNSGKNFIHNAKWQKTNREKRHQAKEYLAQIVQDCFNEAKTQNEFLELLQERNIYHYERNGIATGIVFEDIKYRFHRLGISSEILEKLPLVTNEIDQSHIEIESLRPNPITQNMKNPTLKEQQDLDEMDKIRQGLMDRTQLPLEHGMSTFPELKVEPDQTISYEEERLLEAAHIEISAEEYERDLEAGDFPVDHINYETDYPDYEDIDL